MTNARTVKDASGRAWACRQDNATALDNAAALKEGQDVSILCTTATVTVPVRLTVGWQWMKMADNGLARLIAAASPAPKQVMV